MLPVLLWFNIMLWIKWCGGVCPRLVRLYYCHSVWLTWGWRRLHYYGRDGIWPLAGLLWAWRAIDGMLVGEFCDKRGNIFGHSWGFTVSRGLCQRHGDSASTNPKFLQCGVCVNVGAMWEGGVEGFMELGDLGNFSGWTAVLRVFRWRDCLYLQLKFAHLGLLNFPILVTGSRHGDPNWSNHGVCVDVVDSHGSGAQACEVMTDVWRVICGSSRTTTTVPVVVIVGHNEGSGRIFKDFHSQPMISTNFLTFVTVANNVYECKRRQLHSRQGKITGRAGRRVGFGRLPNAQSERRGDVITTRQETLDGAFAMIARKCVTWVAVDWFSAEGIHRRRKEEESSPVRRMTRYMLVDKDENSRLSETCLVTDFWDGANLTDHPEAEEEHKWWSTEWELDRWLWCLSWHPGDTLSCQEDVVILAVLFVEHFANPVLWSHEFDARSWVRRILIVSNLKWYSRVHMLT